MQKLPYPSLGLRTHQQWINDILKDLRTAVQNDDCRGICLRQSGFHGYAYYLRAYQKIDFTAQYDVWVESNANKTEIISLDIDLNTCIEFINSPKGTQRVIDDYYNKGPSKKRGKMESLFIVTKNHSAYIRCRQPQENTYLDILDKLYWQLMQPTAK
ncbi:MAG TPA: hypothetical protein VLL52_02780 [Anaerolineae bacterium]|nr:hypothetical protein [Anaerolineae bacterium]